MKKLISLLLAVILVSALISVPVMAAQEDLAGTWYAHSIESDGTMMEGSLLASLGMVVTLTLNEDGTAVLSMAGQEIECTWEGETLILNESPVPIELTDGELKIEPNGSAIIFGKTAPEAADVSLAPVVENPELSDFDGTWNAVTYFAMGFPLPMKLSTATDCSLQIKDGAVAYTELNYDLNDTSEPINTIEKEFTAALGDDGTLFVDFNDEKVLVNIVPGSSGIRLTLHEDGKLTGDIPELTETMQMLSGASQAGENTDAQAADASDAPSDAEGSSGGSSSGGESMSAYIIFEKAE